eukprot:11331908-Alexandrium_andersonii.AAC.1
MRVAFQSSRAVDTDLTNEAHRMRGVCPQDDQHVDVLGDWPRPMSQLAWGGALRRTLDSQHRC